MKPIDQTVFGFPGGNSFSACVASLLELPLGDMPYFMGDGGAWWARFNGWLGERDLYALSFSVQAADPVYPPGLYIAGGRSPRAGQGTTPADAMHAVVARGSQIVHDPHPSRDGLAGGIADAILLLPLDPRGLVRQAVAASDLRQVVRDEIAAAMGLRPAEVMSRSQVADLLGVLPNVVARWVREHGLPATKIGSIYRFRRSEVLAWLEASKRQGGPPR